MNENVIFMVYNKRNSIEMRNFLLEMNCKGQV